MKTNLRFNRDSKGSYFFSFSLIDEKATRKSLNRDDARSVGQELWTKASLENSISNNYIGRYSRSRSFVAVERNLISFASRQATKPKYPGYPECDLTSLLPLFKNNSYFSYFSLFSLFHFLFFFSLSELRRNVIVKRWIKQFSQISRLLR